MCGIAGLLHLHEASSPTEEQVRLMLGQIRHRGPDEFGIYLGAEVALGSARLSIVDLVGGQQPIGNETGDVWIVYNGEIFNHPELRTELEGRGHIFRTHTDTEILVHLYEEFGTEGLTRLNGQFAFALWDEKQRTLLLARDRLGVRPLYYTVCDNRLIFASEVKSIFADPRVPRSLDTHGIEEVFTYWSCLPPRTCFSGIRELPPGHLLVAREGALKLRRYWQLSFAPPGKIHGVRNEDALIDEFRALLGDATRIRLRADVPVGAYLSGGVDSAVIAAIVQQSGISRLDTFSIAFDDPEFDESGAQQAMARFLGTQHQTVRISSGAIAEILPEVIWHTEATITRTAPAPMFLLSRLAHDHGYKVVLTGEGADEFLAGYDIFKEAAIRRFWAREPQSQRRPQLLQRLYPEIGRLGAAGTGFLNAFFGAGLTDIDASDYSHRLRWRNNRRNLRFFAEERAASNGSADHVAGSLEFPEDFGRWDPLAKAQYLETRIFLSGYLLSSQGDRVAMAHALEGRYPFLDVRVTDFCATLPTRLKLRGLREKWLLREAFRSSLPPEIGRRRKRPYRAPIHRCFSQQRMPDYIEELCSERSLRKSGIFKPASAAKLFTAVRQGRALGETDDMALIGILSTELLHHQFVERFAARPAVGALDRTKIVDARVAPKSRAPAGFATVR